ncbi:MAG: heme-copper oxidase subunit III [Planctomycetes bacterium]|nr:heme-copper oxidase subunit III [Planctomycetota bacterium]
MVIAAQPVNAAAPARAVARPIRGGGSRPPGGRDDGHPGGGDDGHGHGPWEEHESGPPIERRYLAMWLFLIAVAMLFVAFVGAYTVLRNSTRAWPEAGAAALPHTLWYSTAAAVASSVMLGFAARGLARGERGRLVDGLLGALALGVTFMVAQAMIWNSVAATGLATLARTYGALFFVITGLHVVHVTGGMVALVVVAARAARGRYDAGERFGFDFCATYWHFVTLVWLLLFAMLYLVELAP